MKKFLFGKDSTTSPESRRNDRDGLMDHLDGTDERAVRPELPQAVEEDPLAQKSGIGIIFQIGRDGGWYIKSLDPDGAAVECGILQQGDCLIAVDGKPVHKKSAEYMSSKIMGKLGTCAAPPEGEGHPRHGISLKPVGVKFRRNVVSADGSCSFTYVAPVLTRGKPAHLPKPAGIGIVFKVGPDKAMHVKAMAADGPAESCGLIKIDDRLMAVNGKSVLCKPVVSVTPQLTGAYGTSVELVFLRKDDSGQDEQVKVTLKRGKKAAFTDDKAAPSRAGKRSLSLEVPDGCAVGDEIEATDEETGLVVKVRVPDGAEAGTLLRVPVPEAASPVGAGKEPTVSSDPAVLTQIMNEVREIKGTDNFLYQHGASSLHAGALPRVGLARPRTRHLRREGRPKGSGRERCG